MNRIFPYAVYPILALFWIVEVYLVASHGSVSFLNASAPDETLFLGIGSLPNNFASGYGPVFWTLIYSAKKIFGDIHSVIILRVFFVSLKYLSFLIGSITLMRFGKKRVGALFLMICVSTPGFLFFGKVISPEYELLFFISMTLFFVMKDNGRIGRYFYIAVICSILAVLTKVTILPLTFGLPVYGLIITIWDNQSNRFKSLFRYGITLSIIFVSVILILLISIPLSQVVNDLNAIINDAPPTSFGWDRFSSAWNRDNVTWDQIIAGGIRADFFPAVVSALMTILFFISSWIKKEYQRLVFPVVLFGVASFMLMPMIVHGMAFSWYLFAPFFIYIFIFCIMVKDSDLRIFWVFTSIFVLIFIFSGASRLLHHVCFKYNNNIQLVRHYRLFKPAMSFLGSNYPQAITGNADILVPVPMNESKILPFDIDIPILPARVALNCVGAKKWIQPDFLIVNLSVYEKRSPLLQYVVGDKIRDYAKVKSIEDLDIYLNKRIVFKNKKK
jgi:hypothetical protein